MAAPQRTADSALSQRLYGEARRFSFFQAVHLLEMLAPDVPPLGEGLEPDREPVRFEVNPGLSFPPNEITELKPAADDMPPRMAVTFMGLIGPSGVLPYWYTELALERIRQKDETLVSFLNLFHHRLITLFYRGWKKHRLPENYRPGGRDDITRYLLSLCGLGTAGMIERIGLPPESLAFYSGLLSMPCPTAVGIEAAVAYLAGVDASVEQFVEALIPISEEDHTCLGAANAHLGVDVLVGSHVWDSATRFRVHLGPMDFEHYRRFLPTGTMLKPIFAFIRYMVGVEYEFDLKVILEREEVPPCRLGGDTQLGLTTWLLNPRTTPGSDASILVDEGMLVHRKPS